MELSVLLGIVGPWQVVLIIAIVLLLFGGKKIPELMKGIGQGMKDFKNAIKEEDADGKTPIEKK
ncbi:MAG: twin-arginine translocase TatA/TatE family subunit [Bacteroidales bacterium]